MTIYKDYIFNHSMPTYVHSYIAEPIIKLLDHTKNKNILDLGCGNGALVKRLVNLDFNAFGTDASTTGIEKASEFSNERFALQDLSADELPEKFKNLKFDTIISTEVIEHLYDPKSFIKFCKKHLKDNGGGELIISTPYHGYLKNLVIGILGKWDTHANPLWDGGHIKFWSKRSIYKLLESEGFEVINFIGCGRLPFFWKSMIIKAKI